MLIEMKNVDKVYNTGRIEVRALKNINLTIDRGEFCAIVGPSGSGKTTLLNIIGCIDVPTKGEVFLDGKSIINHDSRELAYLRRDYYGFVFQTYNLIPVLTVYENIELPLRLIGKYNKEEIRDRVFKVIKEVGLEGTENRKPSELSGGQQQRVSIARAIVKSPKVILADEPTANIDSKTGEDIVELMRKMNEIEGVTFIFSTHDQLIMKHAKRLIRIRDGVIEND